MQAGKPFDVRKIPFFYGWIIIIVGTLGAIMSVPGQTIGVSAFTESLIRDFSLTRNQLSLSYGIGTGISAFMLTFAGRMYDRYGARIVAVTASVMLGVVLLYLTIIDHLYIFVENHFIALPETVFTFILITLGFLGIRFFGQGVLTMASRNMVMKWYEKRRGLANAIFGVAMSFGFSVTPPIYNGLIEVYDWKIAWIISAIVVGIIFSMVILVFFRDNPQECGLSPDGNLSEKQKEKNVKSQPATDYTLKQAKKTYSFWVFNITLAMFAFYSTAMTFHIESIFEKAGMPEEKAFSMFFPASVIAVALHFTGSWLSDFIKLKYLLIVQTLGYLMVMAGLFSLDKGNFFYWLLITGQGVSQSMFGILSAVTWPRFFGIKHLGAISGYNLSWVVAGSAVSPLFFSILLKINGTYNPPVLICAVVSFILLLLSLRAENVNQKEG